MVISDVRIILARPGSERVLAFVQVVFGDFLVVKDLKLIDGPAGPFVAMPSRKLTDHCPQCRHKNALQQHYCGNCGARLAPDRAARDAEGRLVVFADVAHPLDARARKVLTDAVLAAYRRARAAPAGAAGDDDGPGFDQICDRHGL